MCASIENTNDLLLRNEPTAQKKIFSSVGFQISIILIGLLLVVFISLQLAIYIAEHDGIDGRIYKDDEYCHI